MAYLFWYSANPSVGAATVEAAAAAEVEAPLPGVTFLIASAFRIHKYRINISI